MESDRDPQRLLRGLDSEQQIAVSTTAAPLVIVAGAGSGKTTVLVRRIAHRIACDTADPRHVLALTFTRDAAGELRRRLRRLDIREPIESGTFHAVALRLLRDRAVTHGTAAPVVAPDRGRLIREVLTETRTRCEVGAALADLDWARARLVAPEQFADANRLARRRPALSPDAFVQVASRYELIKRRRGVVDFDDLLQGVLVQMRGDATFTDIVRWRFRHLFVDEAQDLNPLQFDLLEHIRGGRPDICLVGDHRQAVYGWNGADPAMLLEAEQRFPGVTMVRLSGNYRCSPQIVRSGAAALSAAKLDDDGSSRRPDGRPIVILECADEHDEATQVARLARELSHRHGFDHVAVLARTNEQLVLLSRALEAAGIPVRRAVGASPLERAIAEAGRCTGHEQLAAWVEGVWAGGAAEPMRLRVAEEADRFLSSREAGGFRAWVEARQPFDDLEPEDGIGAVTVLTFHAAKGREWAAVVVTGVEEGLVPHSSATGAAQRAEEARLLYVALTRAGDELIITSAQARNSSVRAPSAWLAAIREANPPEITGGPPHLDPAHPDGGRLESGHPESGHRVRAEEPLDALKRWRTTVARASAVADVAVCPDRVLRSLISDRPVDVADLGVRLGIGVTAAERLAPQLFSVLDQVGAASTRSTITGA
jgi:DNA helicase-2/ATP-dependent DNA helicase PcrA